MPRSTKDEAYMLLSSHSIASTLGSHSIYERELVGSAKVVKIIIKLRLWPILAQMAEARLEQLTVDTMAPQEASAVFCGPSVSFDTTSDVVYNIIIIGLRSMESLGMCHGPTVVQIKTSYFSVLVLKYTC